MQRYVVSQFDSNTFVVINEQEQREICVCSNYEDYEDAEAALLLYGMSRLKARGMEVARLGTSIQNLPMQRAAQKAGFTVEAENVWFQKIVG